MRNTVIATIASTWKSRLRAKRFAGKPSKPAVKLIGHSHSQQIFLAAQAEGVPLEGFNFWTAPQPAIAEDRSAFHPDIAAFLATGTVFSAVGGAVHNVIGLVQHPQPFDFVLPEHPDLPVQSDARLLPCAAVVDVMMEQLQEYLDIIGMVRKTATGRVFHIEPPPPYEDAERLLPDVPWMFFQNLTRSVAPAPLRFKLWRLATRLTRRFCEANEIGFVDHPPAAVDSRGYLRPDFYGDAMHVNQAYGALVLAQIRSLA